MQKGEQKAGLSCRKHSSLRPRKGAILSDQLFFGSMALDGDQGISQQHSPGISAWVASSLLVHLTRACCQTHSKSCVAMQQLQGFADLKTLCAEELLRSAGLKSFRPRRGACCQSSRS